MVDEHTSLLQHFLKMAIAQWLRRVPTDAKLLVRNRHDLLFVFLVFIVVQVHANALAILIQAYEFEHAARADLEAATATDAFFFVQGGHKGRCPGGAAGQR